MRLSKLIVLRNKVQGKQTAVRVMLFFFSGHKIYESWLKRTCTARVAMEIEALYKK